MSNTLFEDGDYIVSETASSVWAYHLRRLGADEPRYHGAAGIAICGASLGWDVLIPVDTFMIAEMSPTFRPCTLCRKLALKVKGVVDEQA